MILTGAEIEKGINEKKIYIENFIREKLNPNSYNLTLSEHMLVYRLNEYKTIVDGKEVFYLDSRENNITDEIIIPKDGLVLLPNKLYIASTNEMVGTNEYVPILDGRSSIGRLGIKIHITAGFGDIGYYGRWTLEIEVTYPVKIYPNMEICQVRFETPCGEISKLYSGKYQYTSSAASSKLYLENR